MHPFHSSHVKKRHGAAYTLIEILVATGLASILGLVLYGVASEGLTAFARNASINRSYSNCRQTLERISQCMQSAGHTPLLIDATGAATTVTPAAGIRFWRYGSNPVYAITTPTLTATSITVQLAKLTSTGANGITLPAPAVGDMITIAALGFQAQVVSVSAGSSTATLTFSGTVAANTSPTLTAAALAKVTPTSPQSLSCLDWTSVAFIAVGTQLRYYPAFIPGTTSVATSTNYKVLTYLISSLGAAAPPLPFSLGPTPSVNIDIYGESPDYNNRNQVLTGATTGTSSGYTTVNSANTYTLFQTALAPRNPTILRSPF